MLDGIYHERRAYVMRWRMCAAIKHKLHNVGTTVGIPYLGAQIIFPIFVFSLRYGKCRAPLANPFFALWIADVNAWRNYVWDIAFHIHTAHRIVARVEIAPIGKDA